MRIPMHSNRFDSSMSRRLLRLCRGCNITLQMRTELAGLAQTSTVRAKPATEFGTQKHTPNGWRETPEYRRALMRLPASSVTIRGACELIPSTLVCAADGNFQRRVHCSATTLQNMIMPFDAMCAAMGSEILPVRTMSAA